MIFLLKNSSTFNLTFREYKHLFIDCNVEINNIKAGESLYNKFVNYIDGIKNLHFSSYTIP